VAVIHRHFSPPRMTIEQAVDQFLEYQGARLPGVVHVEYEKLLESIKGILNDRGMIWLNTEERAYFESQRRKTFCEIFGPEKLFAEARRLMRLVESGDTAVHGEVHKHLRGLIRRFAIWIQRQGGL